MDPTRCYLDVLEDLNAEEYEAALERALTLARWLRRGGYYPEGFLSAEVDALLRETIRETAKMVAMVEPNDDE